MAIRAEERELSAAEVASTSTEMWAKVWREELEGVYGGLARTHLEATTCAFKLFEGCERASELQRRAMSALGSLPAPTVELVGDREKRARKDGGHTKGQAARRRLPVFEELERGGVKRCKKKLFTARYHA